MRSMVTLLALILAISSTALAETRTEARSEADEKPAERTIPALPIAIASFGAAATPNGLYVYGGHVGGTHQHSIQNLSTGFWGLDLGATETGWQNLGPVRGLQGLAMVPHGESVCRVGGMEARNLHHDDEEDLYSIDEVECYDSERADWQAMPPLSSGRSSLDAVVHQDHLYAVGGWQLRGKDQEAVWHDTIEILDLKNPEDGWRAVAQPFSRRALSVAALDGKVYAFGGLDREGTRRSLAIFDIATEEWSEGPELPRMAGPMRGFGVSAFAVDDAIYLSGGDGVIHRLEPETGWQSEVGKLRTARFFHRLVPLEDRLAFIAGASSKTHLASIEVLPVAPLRTAEARSAKSTASQASLATKPWPGFRGPGDGHYPMPEPPLHWSEDDNLAWRARLPGYGQSAPVVWSGQVFVTSVEGPNKETLILSALDLESGDVRWRRRFEASQKIESSDMVTRAAPTPAVDANTVFAFWESGDLIALSHHGDVRWKRSLTNDYGEFSGNHGVGSSPVLADELVIVQITHEGPSYTVGIDRKNGVNRWKANRPPGVAWTTPVVVDRQLISSAAGRIEALNVGTGEQEWLFTDVEGNNVPSVAIDDQLVVAASSKVAQSLALPRGLKGTIDDERIAWRVEGVTSGFGSPIFHDRCVFFINKAGIATCVDRESGASAWQHRLGDACWASPIAVDDLVYFFTKKGQTTVLRPALDGPEVVAENTLGLDGMIYGVAAAEGSFIVRSGTEIARIGKAPSAPSIEAHTAFAAVSQPE